MALTLGNSMLTVLHQQRSTVSAVPWTFVPAAVVDHCQKLHCFNVACGAMESKAWMEA